MNDPAVNWEDWTVLTLADMPWRTGTSPNTRGQNLYACPPGSSHRDGEIYIGVMFNGELAEHVVEAHNAWLRERGDG